MTGPSKREKFFLALKQEVQEWNLDIHGSCPVWLLSLLVVGCAVLPCGGVWALAGMLVFGGPLFLRGIQIHRAKDIRVRALSFSWWDIPMVLIGITFWIAVFLFILNPVLFSVNLMFKVFGGWSAVWMANLRPLILIIATLALYLGCAFRFFTRVIHRVEPIDGQEQEMPIRES